MVLLVCRWLIYNAQAAELSVQGRGRGLDVDSLNQDRQCSHVHAHIVQAAVLCLAAVYSAGAALHDQPFRAMHSIAVASTLDALLLMWAYYCHRMSCKRKPL